MDVRGGVMRAGACPSCGSALTSVDVSIDGARASVRAKCGKCGFEDSRLTGDAADLDVLVEVARKAFTTVDSRVQGEVPALDEVAGAIGELCAALCEKGGCGTCRIGGPSKFASGLVPKSCDSLAREKVAARLRSRYPSWM